MTAKKTKNNEEEPVIEPVMIEGFPNVEPPKISMSVETLAKHHQVLVTLLAENQDLKAKFDSLLQYAQGLEKIINESETADV